MLYCVFNCVFPSWVICGTMCELCISIMGDMLHYVRIVLLGGG